MAGPWEMFAPAADAGPWTQFDPVEQPPEEPQSFFRQVADVPLGVAKGAVQGVRMIADAFGAGSDTSQTIKGAEEYLGGLMSAAAKKDQQEISRLMKDAEDKGVLDQVKAGFQAFATAPVDLLTQAFGTEVPVILGTVGAKLLGAGAGCDGQTSEEPEPTEQQRQKIHDAALKNIQNAPPDVAAVVRTMIVGLEY